MEQVVKTNRIWDVVVLWPFIFFVLVLIGVPVVATLAENEQMTGIVVALGMLAFLLYVATTVLMIVSYIYAIHRLYTQTALPVESKRTWLILVIIFNIFAIPFLHFMHLRR